MTGRRAHRLYFSAFVCLPRRSGARYSVVVTKRKDSQAPTPEAETPDNESEANDVVETVLEMAAIPFFVDEAAAERAGILTPAISEIAPIVNADEHDDDDDDDDDTIRLEEEIFDEENWTENED